MLTDAQLRQLRDHVHGAGGCLYEPQYRDMARECLALRAEVARLRSIVKGVHGALCDARTVPVPDEDADLYDSVMQIVRERDAAVAQREAVERERDEARSLAGI